MVHRNGFGDMQTNVRNIHIPRPLSAWCNFTWDLRIDAFQVHTCPRAKVCGRGEKLEGEDLVPFICSLLKASIIYIIIFLRILEIGINQYPEYLFEDRSNPIYEMKGLKKLDLQMHIEEYLEIAMTRYREMIWFLQKT